jgi:hypothetical protein
MKERETIFSPCRQYRYTLWREFDMFKKDYVMFVGLNPSKADEIVNDNTVTRCINFAKSWGFGALCMTNIFAYRATKPKDMRAQPQPVGPENDKWLVRCARGADLVVAAWGNHGPFLGRDKEVIRLLDNLSCLGITNAGQPIHPLYVPAYRKPIPYRKDMHPGA